MQNFDNPVKRYKAQIAGFKRARRFIDYSHSFDFARELESFLYSIQAEITNPESGLGLTVAFYKCDDAIIERCDDSNGDIGDVFRFTACDLFVDYAVRCQDKEFLLGILCDLFDRDNYSLRGEVIDKAYQFLPDELLRRLADRFWQSSLKESKDSSEHCYLLIGVKSLARQLKDAPLYEKACKAYWGKLPTIAHYNIAEIYLESGDAKTALDWIEHIPESERYRADKRNELLLVIYEKLGYREKLSEIAWRVFRDYRSAETLATLLTAIGPEKRDQVVDNETRLILGTKELSYSDCQFLIEVRRMEDAETYLLDRAAQLDGQFYPTLLDLANSMEKDKRLIAATVIYRALLDSILMRAISKYYYHGIRYLKKLDKLAEGIGDWRDVQDHLEFKAELLKVHARKTSFWGKYK